MLPHASYERLAVDIGVIQECIPISDLNNKIIAIDTAPPQQNVVILHHTRVELQQSRAETRGAIRVVPHTNREISPNGDRWNGEELSIGIRVDQSACLRQVSHALQVGHAAGNRRDRAGVDERPRESTCILQERVRVERVVGQQAGVHVVEGRPAVTVE
jgi:hypothetical protein